MKKQRILLCLVIALSIIAVGLLIISISVHGKLKQYEDAYQLNDQEIVCQTHEDTIDRLTAELAEANRALESSTVNTIDQVNQDMTYALETYYTINADHPADERYAKLKNYLSKDMAAALQKSTSAAVDYTQSIKITDKYYARVSSTEARLLYFCDTTLKSNDWGTLKESNLFQIKAEYDSKTKTWRMVYLAINNNVNFQEFMAQ